MSMRVRESVKSRTYRPRTKSRTGTRGTSSPVSSSMRLIEYSQGSAPSSMETSLFRSTREKEKVEMQDLNARLAHYIEISRYNDALNKNLLDEIDSLKSAGNSGLDSIKNMYETEMGQLRKLLDEAEGEKAGLQAKIDQNELEVNDLRDEVQELEEINEDNMGRLRKQDDDVATYEAQNACLRRRCDNLQGEKDRDKNNLDKFKAEVLSLRNDLTAETVARIDSQNQCQTLREELEFLKDVHAQELKELSSVRSRDPFAQSRDWWSSEFANCIREIQEEYDNRFNSLKNDMETYYSMKVQEVQTGAARNDMESGQYRDRFTTLKSTHSDMKGHMGQLDKANELLRSQNDELQRELRGLQMEYDGLLVEKDSEMAEIRAHLERTLLELQSITDRNLSLQLEIAAYRKLLEWEESRMGIRDGSQFRTSDEDTPNISNIYDDSLQFSFPNPDRKTTYQRSAKGPITITRVQSDGSFVEIENTNVSQNENLGEWRMVQCSDDRVYEYVFEDYVLKGGTTVKIWASGQGCVEEGDLVWADRPCLTTGSVVTTTLLNQKGDEKATFTQKTVFTV